DSTISGNIGNDVGGIFSLDQCAILRSTISDNTAIPTVNLGVGGINAYHVTMDNSTISGNTVIADHLALGKYDFYLSAAGGFLGGGLVSVQFSGAVGLRNTIIAG